MFLQLVTVNSNGPLNDMTKVLLRNHGPATIKLDSINRNTRFDQVSSNVPAPTTKIQHGITGAEERSHYG